MKKKIIVNPFIYELAQYELWLSNELKNPYSNIDPSLIKLVKELKKNTTIDWRTEKETMVEIIDYLKKCQKRNTHEKISENEIASLRKKMFIGCSVFPKLDSAINKNYYVNNFLKIFVLKTYDWKTQSTCDAFIRPSFDLFTISQKKEKIIGIILESYSKNGIIPNSLKAFACRTYSKIDKDVNKIAEMNILNCNDIKEYEKDRDRCVRDSATFALDNGDYVCDDGVMRAISQEEKKLRQLCLNNDIGSIKNEYGCDENGWRELYRNEKEIKKMCAKKNWGEVYNGFFCDEYSGWIPEKKYFFFTDQRDGKTYRTTKNDNLYWMAENLNYEYRVDGMIFENSCYRNDCDVYGRYYTRSSAMDSKGIFSEDAKGCDFGNECERRKNVRGVCPSGWRLPTYDEWKSLGIIDNYNSSRYETKYKTNHLYVQDEIWKKRLENKNILPEYISSQYGNDEIGFSIIPYAGLYNFEKRDLDNREKNYFWLVDSSIDVIGDGMQPYTLMHNLGANVRCVTENLSNIGFYSTKKTNAPKVIAKAPKVIIKVKNGLNLFDTRDGKKYKTVIIENQKWMAENLNFFGTYMGNGSRCYDDKDFNCDKYGRLYTWATAMDSAGKYSYDAKGCGHGKNCDNSKRVKGICPNGWHLPNKSEWETLWNTIGGAENAGMRLKSTEDWTSGGTGSDDYGFAILPAGYYNEDKFENLNVSSSFWTSTEKDSFFAFAAYVDERQLMNFDEYGYSKLEGRSIRCVMD